MANMNCIVLQGRLVREPKRWDEPSVHAKFTLAVSGYAKDAVDYFDCQLWGKSAETLLQYVGKGDEILVTGNMTSKKYTGKDGVERVGWSVRCDRFSFCQKASRNEGNDRPIPTTGPGRMAQPPSTHQFEEDDSLPF